MDVGVVDGWDEDGEFRWLRLKLCRLMVGVLVLVMWWLMSSRLVLFRLCLSWW